MNDIAIIPPKVDWAGIKALVLDTVTSPITRRVYEMALNEFLAWYQLERRPGLSKAVVNEWRATLQARGLGSSSINNRLSAIRKLATEAADNGLLATDVAAAIGRVKGAKSQGVRVGNWLTLRQAQLLLNAPDCGTTRGVRDRAILAVLLGCGLRRSEAAALTFEHVQQRDGRWCILNLLGKHGRVRTVPMPTWVKVALDLWTTSVGIGAGFIFRPVNRGSACSGERISDKAIWQMLRRYVEATGLTGLAPHDMRRTCAKLCRAAGGELEQIQLLLGHASVQTTERYLGTKQDLIHAPNDAIKLKIVL